MQYEYYHPNELQIHLVYSNPNKKSKHNLKITPATKGDLQLVKK